MIAVFLRGTMKRVKIVGSPRISDWVKSSVSGALDVDDVSAPDVVVVEQGYELDAINQGHELNAPGDLALVLVGDPPGDRSGWSWRYIVRPTLSGDDLRTLLVALTRSAPWQPAALDANDADGARLLQAAVRALRPLSTATTIRAAEDIATSIVRQMLDAEHSYCLYYDRRDLSLWSEAQLQSIAGDERSSDRGIVGFVALTGECVVANSANQDSRYVATHDNPRGTDEDHLVAVPVLGAMCIHAVLVAARPARRAAFGSISVEQLKWIAAILGPQLEQIGALERAQQVLDDAAVNELFSAEATEAQRPTKWGDVVRVSSKWANRAFWGMLVALVGTLVATCVVDIPTYATGVAVIKSSDRTAVVCNETGFVTNIDVAAGAHVTRGSRLMQLDDTEQRATYERVRAAHAALVQRRLAFPTDSKLQEQLRELEKDVEAAQLQMAARRVVATTDGYVGDIQVGVGERVARGQAVATIVRPHTPEVIAFFPAKSGPRLHNGMALHLQLTDDRTAYRSLSIESVSSNVASATEAQKLLAPRGQSEVRVNGPLVMVKANLTDEVEEDGPDIKYLDGTLGTANVRLDSEPLVWVLFPFMRSP